MTARCRIASQAAAGVLLGVALHAQAPLRLPNGDYLLRWNEGGRTREARFIPADKIRPRMEVAVAAVGDGTFRYRYTIANDRGAEQNINTCLFGVSAPAGFAAVPAGWSRTLPHEADPRVGVRMDARADGTWRGLAPGEAIAGFEMVGGGRPGPIVVQCFGHEFPRLVPNELTPELQRLLAYVPGETPVLIETTGPVRAD